MLTRAMLMSRTEASIAVTLSAAKGLPRPRRALGLEARTRAWHPAPAGDSAPISNARHRPEKMLRFAQHDRGTIWRTS